MFTKILKLWYKYWRTLTLSIKDLTIQTTFYNHSIFYFSFDVSYGYPPVVYNEGDDNDDNDYAVA